MNCLNKALEKPIGYCPGKTAFAEILNYSKILFLGSSNIATGTQIPQVGKFHNCVRNILHGQLMKEFSSNFKGKSRLKSVNSEISNGSTRSTKIRPCLNLMLTGFGDRFRIVALEKIPLRRKNWFYLITDFSQINMFSYRKSKKSLTMAGE